MNHSSDERVAHLTEELERLRRELAQLQQATRHSRPSGVLRSGRLMPVPVLLLGTWLLSAGASPNQDDLEKRVSDLEARLVKGPGTTTRIQAPFEVVGAGGNVILQVSQAFPTVSNGVGIFWQGKDGGVTVSKSGHDIAGMGTSEGGDGGLLFIGDQYGVPRAEVRATDGVNVLNGGGKVVASMVTIEGDEGRFAIMRGDKMIASMEGGSGGGLLDIAGDDGKSVAQIGIEDDNGYIATMDPKGRGEVELGVSDKGEPELTVNHKGKPRATLGLRTAAGFLSLSNPKDHPVANVTASGSGDAGAVIVGNGSGKGVASITAGADGSGLVQVFQPGAGSVVVLGQDKAGGLVQIKNGSGTPVANLKASSEGGGYWQLTDPGGNPMVEGGSAEGRGIVRAGPFYTCTPAMGTALVGVAMLPDCIRGRDKK